MKAMLTAAITVLGTVSLAWSDSVEFRYFNLAVPEASSAFASGINNGGDIVGTYSPSVGNNGNDRGFLYKNGTYNTLTHPLGTFGTSLRGINNRGQIVGVYEDASGPGGQHAFLYSNGAYTTLTPPWATSGAQAHGINDLGQIVGWYFTGDCGTCTHGFFYSNGVYTVSGLFTPRRRYLDASVSPAAALVFPA
jgi:probable HAF family extracellular repeat protein